MSWPPSTDLELDGYGVHLRIVDPERDADALFSALDHDAVWRHHSGRPRDPAAYAASLTESVAAGRVPWIVRSVHTCATLATGDCVGTSSYLEVSVPDARLEIGSTAYAPAVWGTFVNPAVKLHLLTHAFEVLGAGRVQLKTDVRNVRSQQAIARLGARYEGTLGRYQRRADGTVRHSVLFAVVAEDWPEVRDRLRQRLNRTKR